MSIGLWTDSFRDALVKYYGVKGAQSSAAVLIPAIMSDFCGMLKKSNAGRTVSEDYNTEDGKAVIHVEGVKRLALPRNIMSTKLDFPEFILTKLTVGKEDIPLRTGGEDIGIFTGQL